VPNAKSRKRSARERVAAMRAQQSRAERRRNVLLGLAVAVVLGAGIGGISWYVASRNSGGAVAIAGVESFSGLSRNHVQGKVSYPQTPPVGGQHNPVWLNCGIYTSPVPNENAVHSMEHGAVWVTYRPGLPAAEATALQNLVRGEPQASRSYTILSPYPGLPAPVVASAWGKQLRLSSPGDRRLGQFITGYAQGPQTPEPGAPCSGGVGTPSG
jgi:hypothetical protein